MKTILRSIKPNWSHIADDVSVESSLIKNFLKNFQFNEPNLGWTTEQIHESFVKLSHKQVTPS